MGEPDTFVTVMFYIALMFWTTDFILSFFTGYYASGMEELRPHKVVLHYAMTWMLFDMVVIGLDWMTLGTGAQSGENQSGGRTGGAARLGKSMRIIRVVRSLRLVRLMKLSKVMETVLDQVDSDSLPIIMGMLKGTFMVLGLNHIIACTWFGISRAVHNNSDDVSWIKRAGFDDQDFSLTYKYATSLHWSLTQFTPASMEVFPCNVYERSFAVCVLVFALLVFSSFLSTITSCMTQLRSLGREYTKNISLLRKYLAQHDISAGLSVRILKNVEHTVSRKHVSMREADVPFLNNMSAQLSMELAREINEPWLVKHAFFQLYGSVNFGAFRIVCFNAASSCFFSEDDIVFCDQQRSDKMYFIMTGRLMYVQPRFKSVNREPCELSPGSWCCEHALWTHWKHVGTSHTLEHSDLLTVDATRFVGITRDYIDVLRGSVYYAFEFVEKLNRIMHSELSDLHVADYHLIEQDAALAFKTAGESKEVRNTIREFLSKRYDSHDSEEPQPEAPTAHTLHTQ